GSSLWARLLGGRPPPVVARPVGEVSSGGMRRRQDRGVGVRRYLRQEGRQPVTSLADVSAELPEPPDGGRDADAKDRVAVIGPPTQGRAHVVVLGGQSIEPHQ